MAGPLTRIPMIQRVLDTVSVNRAVENQAKVTGGASNYALQNSIENTRKTEERRKAAADLISLKNINAAQMALPTLRDMKRSDQEDEEEEGHSSDPRKPRRVRRPRPPPPHDDGEGETQK